MSIIDLQGQSNLQKATNYLNDAKLTQAVEYFEKALKNKEDRTSASLYLAMLYPLQERSAEGAKLIDQFFEESKNPYPELYSLWFSEAVMGSKAKKKDYQLRLFEKIVQDERHAGLFDGIMQYRLAMHHVFSADSPKADQHFSKINEIKEWQMLGPFDNVMNSGYDKDFGVVAQPQANSTFNSKYGGKISWFTPKDFSKDGYFFINSHFNSFNSIVYTQTFVTVEEDQEVFLKLGYSGSLKVWINDQVVYQEPKRRKTEMDYFCNKISLNKGANRILIQLGDHEESYANFCVRLTDLQHQPLDYSVSTNYQPYTKSKNQISPIVFPPLAGLEKKAESGDLLYTILLARAYKRSLELDKAEKILLAAYKKYPKNILILRNLIQLFDSNGNTTEQNRIYQIYEELNPNDFDILSNELKELVEKKDKEKFIERSKVFLDLFPSEYNRISLDIAKAGLYEENKKMIDFVGEWYEKYPDDYLAMSSYYRIVTSTEASPEESDQILIDFLENNYNYNVILELANNLINRGKHEEALKWIEKSIYLTDYNLEGQKKILNTYYLQEKYQEAIERCELILKNIPSDFRTHNDMALLYNITGDKEKSKQSYLESLKYFPFSFVNNEKIRALEKKSSPLKFIEDPKPLEIIKDYETNFKTDRKKAYDIVYQSNSHFIFNSLTRAVSNRYILKINTEQAIQDWQSLNMAADQYMSITINDVQTIKSNGNRIDGEKTGNKVVLTNLEIGDYVYVDYTEKQVSGGKSSLFFSDFFAFNSFYPTYIKEYNIVAEKGVPLNIQFLNEEIKVEKEEREGFDIYKYRQQEPAILEDESYAPSTNDIANIIHISATKDWEKIASWYGDLSSHQAQPDFTIKSIVKELFDGKSLTPKEKAEVIYDFVCGNIQYSFLDFRQSGYIPQSASDVYHSRLGDCKDVSTLYASIAREAGLSANLILINTRDNGKNAVVLPSLNFNHCIVKVNLPDESLFLELTDPYLPFGYLKYYHRDAAILEIPHQGQPQKTNLTHLKINKGFESKSFRQTNVKVKEDRSLEIAVKNSLSGLRAASTCEYYRDSDNTKRKDDLSSSVSKEFNSNIVLNDLQFSNLELRSDTGSISYSFSVPNEVIKTGSFKTMKIPFMDILGTKNIFTTNERAYEFDFVTYEDTNEYEERLKISLPEGQDFMEIPEGVHLEFAGNIYDLQFEKVAKGVLSVKRIYHTNIDYISKERFEEFKTFIMALLEAESTYLVFK